MAFSGPCSTPEAGSAPGGDRGQGAGVSAELRTYAHGWMTRRTIENLLCRKCSGRAMLCVFVMNGRATCDPYTWMWNAVEGGLKPPNGDQADTRSVKSQVTLAKCARNTCDKGGAGVSAELRTYAHGWMTRRTIENSVALSPAMLRMYVPGAMWPRSRMKQPDASAM